MTKGGHRIAGTIPSPVGADSGPIRIGGRAEVQRAVKWSANYTEYYVGTVWDPGAGVEPVLSATNCTIVDNIITDAYPGGIGGEITNSGDVINCIVWGKSENQIGNGVRGDVEYSCIEGG